MMMLLAGVPAAPAPPPPQNNFGDTMSDGLAGPLGLLIIVLLAIATVLLIRNMNSRLRRLPERFPGQVPTVHTIPAGARMPAAGDGSGPGAADRSDAGVPPGGGRSPGAGDAGSESGGPGIADGSAPS